MSQRVVKRTIFIAGRRTSISLENSFWEALGEIAARSRLSRSELIARIEAMGPHVNLSSAVRIHVLDYYRQIVKASEGGE
jgi:predicted DNA-binding ribbon-helix-helix protein